MQKIPIKMRVLHQTGAAPAKLKAGEKQLVCEQCTTPIPTEAELCPQCGVYVDNGHCSFCDFELEEEDVFCPDCGNPRAGINCPKCGTLNFRNFCSQCNAPLNELAQESLDESAADPLFVEMKSLSVILGKMEQALDREEEKPSVKTDHYNNNLLANYQELLTSVSPGREQRKTPVIRTTGNDEQVYRQKVLEMQALMDRLKPEEGTTPRVQRDYYSARKLPVDDLHTQRPIGWMCDYCRLVHRQPSECVYKELGGKWIFE